MSKYVIDDSKHIGNDIKQTSNWHDLNILTSGAYESIFVGGGGGEKKFFVPPLGNIVPNCYILYNKLWYQLYTYID